MQVLIDRYTLNKVIIDTAKRHPLNGKKIC